LGIGDIGNVNIPTKVNEDLWNKISAGSSHVLAIKQ
jgi:hypothetical protein